jgi:serine/threonine protein kinase
MPSPSTVTEFTELVFKSGVTDERRLTTYLDQLRATSALPAEPLKMAEALVRDGLLTRFQAEQILQGKWKRFTIGKYKVLERLGAGGMGSVYLCEHMLMKRRVAVKVLPAAKAEDPAALERFYREARAVAALDHPNIVRAYDIDQDEKLHFLVMEHVDGASLQEIVKKSGPLGVLRAAHYMRQAALGLQHAHEAAGLVHRDIKPGNILVDRNGIVKILDMGLARFFHDEEDMLTRKYDENVLGTADYLAPEQALDSHGVDIRADIYSLGATFYFCLTGHPPFVEGSVAQKLIWHQTRQPRALRLERPETPEGLIAVVERMMAKDPGHRYQSPLEVAEALVPWTQTPIPPPPDEEMPQHCRAALAVGVEASMAVSRSTAGMPSPSPRRPWQVNTGNSGQLRGPGTPPSGSTRPVPTAASTPDVVVPPAAAPAAPVAAAPRPAPAAPVAAPRPAPARPAQPIAPSRPVQPAPGTTNGSRAPAVPRPAAAPAPVRARPEAAESESPSWDKLAGDTDRASASATTPRASRSSTRSRKPTVATAPSSRRLLWIGLGVGTVVVALLTVLILWLTLGQRQVTDNGTPSAPRQPLIVDPSGANNAIRTLKEALETARAGDRIILRSNIAESVTLAGESQNLKGLVIEGESGKDILWKPPPVFPLGVRYKTLLALRSAENVQVRGITFDGARSADILIQLFGRCDGLKLEDLTLRDFKNTGILVTNCEGSVERPVLLSGLKISSQEPKACGLWFTIRPSIETIQHNSYINVRDCTLQGSAAIVKTEDLKQLREVSFTPPVTYTVAPFPFK